MWPTTISQRRNTIRTCGIPSVAQKKYRDLRECAQIGIALAKVGRGNVWHAGEWYIDAREQFGVSAFNRLVTRPGVGGLSHDTRETYASIRRKFTPELKYLNADSGHDAFLFLWCPAAVLTDALAVMDAWEFAYKTHGVWEKDEEFGTGYYWRMQHEDLLLGVRPKSPRHFVDRAICSVIHAPRDEHSEKPPEVHDMIERALGGRGPFL